MAGKRLGGVIAIMLMLGLQGPAWAGQDPHYKALHIEAAFDHIRSLFPSSEDSHRILVYNWRSYFPLHPGETWALHARDCYPHVHPDFKILGPDCGGTLEPAVLYSVPRVPVVVIPATPE